MLRGGDGSDLICGSEGADVIRGGRTGHILLGGVGSDKIVGGGGDDAIQGGAGADRIVGRTGDDTLAGGGGQDVLLFNAGDGADVIVDFHPLFDLLRLNRGANAFDDVVITSLSNGVKVAFADVSIILQDASAEDIGAVNFIF